jgi:hypothetical protein
METVFDLATEGFRHVAIVMVLLGLAVGLFAEWVFRRPGIRGQRGIGLFRFVTIGLFSLSVVLLWLGWKDYCALLSAYKSGSVRIIAGKISSHRVVRCDSLDGEEIVVAGQTFRFCAELEPVAFTNGGRTPASLHVGRIVRLTAVGSRVVRFEVDGPVSR